MIFTESRKMMKMAMGTSQRSTNKYRNDPTREP